MNTDKLDFKQDYFSLFGLAKRFDVDLAALQKAYVQMQLRYHPDRLGQAADSEAALAAAAHINHAWLTLKQPRLRALYLLAQTEITLPESDASISDASFLAAQWQWRERIEEYADNLTGLEQLLQQLRDEIQQLERHLAEAFDKQKDYIVASRLSQQLSFMESLEESIGEHLQQLSDNMG